jgi:GNAT superfamily N-acetyltransferase
MSQEALNPDQFHYHFKPATPRVMGGSNIHELHAFGERGGWYGNVGSIRWHHKTGEIVGVDTHSEFRRQGVATAALGKARQIASETRGVVRPRHSADRTELGEKWARSLGERLPRRVVK